MTEKTIAKDTELIPSEGNPKVGYKVFEIVAEHLKERADQGKPDTWNRYYELRRNKHWKSDSSKVTLVTANLLAKHHQSTVNTLTDNNPTFNVTQCGEADQEAMDILLRTCEHFWTEQEQQSLLEESVSDGETYGTVIEKASFNPDLEFPLGEVEVEEISLFNFGWYPYKTRQLQKCDAVFHFWAMPVREAKRRWPEFANKIVADGDLLKEIGDNRSEISSGDGKASGYLTTISDAIKNLVNSGSKSSVDSEDTLICEMWVKDYSKDDNGDYKYKGNLRRITCGCAGKLVFSDRNNPSINPELPVEKAMMTYLWDKFPFSKNYSVTDPASPYGMADYEQLEQLNIEVNKTLSQLTLVKDKASRLKFVNPKDSGVPDSHINNFPGILKPSSYASSLGLRYIDPPRVDPHLSKMLELYKDFFFIIAGTFDLDQANSPGKSVIAYKAIAALLENVARMLKGKIRNYSKMIRERGRMYVSHAQNWYTEERWITYKVDGQEEVAAVTGEQLIIPAKLSVVSGSTMPRSQIQEREEALELFKMQAINQKALLKKIDYPDWKNILKEMEQGPFGVLFEKLMGVGVPEQFIQYFQELSQLEEKDLQKMVEKGELPLFQQLMQSLGIGQVEQQEEGPPPIEQAELGIKQAEIDKKNAETMLIQEKILTEKLLREVKAKGVQFDEEKLKIEKTKVLEEIKAMGHKQTMDKVQAVTNITSAAMKKGQGPYSEKGLVSNNV